MLHPELIYRLGITLIPNIGDINAKKLIAYCGSAEAVFNEKKSTLIKIPGIGQIVCNSILESNVLKTAEKEIEFLEKNNFTIHYYLDKNYPKRLKHCSDSPILLFSDGKIDFNAEKSIGIVGTRQITEYGKSAVVKFIEGLAPYNPLVVSGLAFGVDILAHKECVKQNIPTVGILAHGLDMLYPKEHFKTVQKMKENGGIATEFFSNTNPDRENFPKRNRIVAGMCDIILVVEAAEKSGSLITADIAHSYNRDVAAIPGRIGDSTSKGCNKYIKLNKASLVEGPEDIAYMMGWTKDNEKKEAFTPSLFIELSTDESKIIDIVKEKQKIAIDDLSFLSEFSMSKTSGLLLNLELKGVVKSLPGKMVQLN
jgi:DNA processing protein